MTLNFNMAFVDDIRSGEFHRITPALLALALRVAIASLIVAVFSPHVFPYAEEQLTIAGGALLGLSATFMKFAG